MLRLWTTKVWLYAMLALGVALLLVLVVEWDDWTAGQRLVACIYILLPLHAWEEWRIPGGFAWQYNWILGRSDQPARYPMNMLTDMITVFGAMCWGLALLGVGVGPAILMTQIVFSASEVGMHTMFGISMYKRLKSQGKRTWYNPGYATAILGFLPLMIVGIVVLTSMNVTLGEILLALGLLIAFSGLVFGPERLIRRRNPEFDFPPGYYSRFASPADRPAGAA